jgi:metal-responsive CopG/Arc/MetJ family transcriptional regulator
MKISIDLPKDTVETLDHLCRRQNCSRAELIRQAVAVYLNSHLPSDEEHPAYGMWQDRNLDGVDYQRTLRAEWQF